MQALLKKNLGRKISSFLVMNNDDILKFYKVVEISTFKLIYNINIFISNLILENP
jgi:hypothetical protein